MADDLVHHLTRKALKELADDCQDCGVMTLRSTYLYAREVLDLGAYRKNRRENEIA